MWNTSEICRWLLILLLILVLVYIGIKMGGMYQELSLLNDEMLKMNGKIGDLNRVLEELNGNILLLIGAFGR